MAPEREKGSVLFIGNATTLIRHAGFTILTDPNFLHRGQRAYLGYGLTSERLTDPALGIRDLPPLDVVVLSHMHGDHWDRVAWQGLDKDVPIITTPQSAGTRCSPANSTPSRGASPTSTSASSTWAAPVCSGC